MGRRVFRGDKKYRGKSVCNRLYRSRPLPNLREFLQQSSEVIGHGPIVNSRAAQNQSGQNIEIKLWGNDQVAWIFQYGPGKCFMIKDLIADLRVGKQIDQTD